jgi:hypothetical protein
MHAFDVAAAANQKILLLQFSVQRIILIILAGILFSKY